MKSLPPSFQIYRMATAHYISHGLGVAAELGVADLLAEGALDTEALAERTKTHAPSLRRVLRLLVAHGVFLEDEQGHFSNTDVGEALRSGRGRAPARLFTGPAVRATWGDMLETVRTGEPAMNRLFGGDSFEYFEARPEEAAVFDEAMSSFTGAIAAAVAQAYPFDSIGSFVDLGGGDGALACGLLDAHPSLRGAVFDLPRLSGSATARIEERGLSERCDFVGGDFFESVPEGFDAYLLKHVIHDWDTPTSAKILTRVRESVGADGRLLIVESPYPDRIDTTPGSVGATKNDCNMMVATGGQQRTVAEFRALFSEAGFELSQVISTPMTTVIEGAPV